MQFLEIILAAVIAGTLDTVVGFGGALLLVPILVLVAGAQEAVILTSIIAVGWTAVRVAILRSFIDPRTMLLMAIGIIPGVFVGTGILERMDSAALRAAIGVALIAFGGYYVIRLYVEIPEFRGWPRWTVPFVGFVAGGVGALLGVGSAPLQTMALTGVGLAPRVVSAGSGALEGVTALLRLGSYALKGMIGREIWVPGALGLIGGAIGALLGLRLVRRDKDSTLELVIGGVLLLAGVRLLL